MTINTSIIYLLIYICIAGWAGYSVMTDQEKRSETEEEYLRSLPQECQDYMTGKTDKMCPELLQEAMEERGDMYP